MDEARWLSEELLVLWHATPGSAGPDPPPSSSSTTTKGTKGSALTLKEKCFLEGVMWGEMVGAGMILGVANLCGCLVLLLEKVGRVCVAAVSLLLLGGTPVMEEVVTEVMELFLGADGKALVAVSKELSGVSDDDW